MSATAPVILPVRQRTPAWLEARLDGIGSSEAAAAIGVSEWESPYSLWTAKLGLVPPPEPTLPMRVGIELEPFVARLYEEETGAKVRRATQLRRHARHAFMLASLDRRAGRKPVEIKVTARATGYGEPGTDEVPDDTLAQVLHQLIVVDEPEGDVAVLVGGRELRVYTVRRDPFAAEMIVEREADFWRHVQERTEPDVDGSEATRRALAARYPRDTGEIVEADAELRDLVARYRTVRRNEDAIATARDELEARLQERMGEASVLRAEGIGEIRWRLPKAGRPGWKLIAGAYRKAYADAREIYGRASVGDWHSDEDLDALVSIYTPEPKRQFGPHRWEEEESE